MRPSTALLKAALHNTWGGAPASACVSQFVLPRARVPYKPQSSQLALSHVASCRPNTVHVVTPARHVQHPSSQQFSACQHKRVRAPPDPCKEGTPRFKSPVTCLGKKPPVKRCDGTTADNKAFELCPKPEKKRPSSRKEFCKQPKPPQPEQFSQRRIPAPKPSNVTPCKKHKSMEVRRCGVLVEPPKQKPPPTPRRCRCDDPPDTPPVEGPHKMNPHIPFPKCPKRRVVKKSVLSGIKVSEPACTGKARCFPECVYPAPKTGDCIFNLVTGPCPDGDSVDEKTSKKGKKDKKETPKIFIKAEAPSTESMLSRGLLIPTTTVKRHLLKQLGAVHIAKKLEPDVCALAEPPMTPSMLKELDDTAREMQYDALEEPENTATQPFSCLESRTWQDQVPEQPRMYPKYVARKPKDTTSRPGFCPPPRSNSQCTQSLVTVPNRNPPLCPRKPVKKITQLINIRAPGCVRRRRPDCLPVEMSPSVCVRLEPPSPSFSECVRDMPPIPPWTECRNSGRLGHLQPSDLKLPVFKQFVPVPRPGQ